MTKESLITFIRQVLPMERAKAELIADNFEPVTIPKNSYLVEAGKVCNTSHYIEKGVLRSFVYDVDANEVTTGFYAENSIASDLLSFFKRSPSKEYLQAITDCQTWAITYNAMQASFHALPEFREYGRLNLVDQYSKLKERMLSMLQQTAEQRYEDLLRTRPDIFQLVPLKYIASYLGIKDTSLSRIRKELMKK